MVARPDPALSGRPAGGAKPPLPSIDRTGIDLSGYLATTS